jgi:tRNA(fMet)-specific endonuclease VapC
MYLLDTDHISLMDRGGKEGEAVRARLAAVAPEEVVTSIVSYEEQMRGWLAEIAQLRGVDKQLDAYRKLAATLESYCATPLLPFDDRALEQFQRLWVQRVRIGTMDLKIASIALASGATLLTRNLSDFGKVPGLTVEDWSTPSSG